LPTYEYHCESCGKNYDLMQSFSAETQHTCEECGKGVAKRVLHAPRVVFKGSGWYATDSRNTSVATSDDSSSSSSESPSSDAGSTDSGDSKIETSAAG
jgi:putative FmdB family regulatory protein